MEPQFSVHVLTMEQRCFLIEKQNERLSQLSFYDLVVESMNQRHEAIKQVEVYGFPDPNEKPSPLKFLRSGEESLTGEGPMLPWDAAKEGIKLRLGQSSKLRNNIGSLSLSSGGDFDEDMFFENSYDECDSFMNEFLATDESFASSSNTNYLSSDIESSVPSTPESGRSSPTSILEKDQKGLKKKLSVRFSSYDEFVSPSPVSATFSGIVETLDPRSFSLHEANFNASPDSSDSPESSTSSVTSSENDYFESGHSRNYKRSTHPLTCKCSTCETITCPFPSCRKLCTSPGDLKRHKNVHTKVLAMKCLNPVCHSSKVGAKGHSRRDSLKRHCNSQRGKELGCYEWNKHLFEDFNARLSEKRKSRKKQKKIEITKEMKQEIMGA